MGRKKQRLLEAELALYKAAYERVSPEVAVELQKAVKVFKKGPPKHLAIVSGVPSIGVIGYLHNPSPDDVAYALARDRGCHVKKISKKDIPED